MDGPLPAAPDLRRERRRVAAVFAVLTAYGALSFALQNGAARLAAGPLAASAEDPFLRFSLLLLPTYLLAVPLTALAMRVVPPEPPVRRRVSAGRTAQVFLMLLPLMFGGSAAGELIGGLADRLTGAHSDAARIVEGLPVWITLVFAVILAPLAEELIFRKLLLDRLRRYGDAAAVLVSGLAFGLFHGNLHQLFYAALIGMLLALVYLRTGRLSVTAALHAAVNLVGGVLLPRLAGSLAGPGDGGTGAPTWAAVLPGLLGGLVLGGSAAGLVLLIRRLRRLRLEPGDVPLGRRAPAVLAGNAGSILFLAFCAALFVLGLIP